MIGDREESLIMLDLLDPSITDHNPMSRNTPIPTSKANLPDGRAFKRCPGSVLGDSQTLKKLSYHTPFPLLYEKNLPLK